MAVKKANFVPRKKTSKNTMLINYGSAVFCHRAEKISIGAGNDSSVIIVEKKRFKFN